MEELKNGIQKMSYTELVQIKRELEHGAFNLKRLISGRIREIENDYERHCTQCSNELDPYNVNSYTLIFGPSDFKKKVSFCGPDCLEYFLKKVKVIKESSKH